MLIIVSPDLLSEQGYSPKSMKDLARLDLSAAKATAAFTVI